MKIIKPSKLNKGDLIGIIAPASNTDDHTKIENGAAYLESLGYKVKLGRSIYENYGYLAGKDEIRINDIHGMFADNEVKAIFCVRGGYGTPRLLNIIDFDFIKENPKIFVGYSDITALQMAFLEKCGLVTFAGPMVAVDFHNNVSNFTVSNFFNVLQNDKANCYYPNSITNNINIIKEGLAEGILIGGNLSILTSLLGTKYLPSFKDKILLLEEIAEPPYKIDRMLNHLILSGKIDQLSGIVFADFSDCIPEKGKPSLELNDILNDFASKLNIPVVSGFQHGHIKDNFTIAFGIRHKINTSDQNNILTPLESAVI